MELLALLSDRHEIIDAVKKSLKDYTVYPVKDRAELEDLLVSVPLGILIIDTLSLRSTQIEEILRSFGRDSAILIRHEGFDENRLEETTDFVEASSLHKDLPAVVNRLAERKRYRDEIGMPGIRSPQHPISLPIFEAPEIRESPGGRFLKERVLIDFAKTLTVNFDIDKLFSHFMNSVMEIIRVSKMSIMLRENNVFTIKAYRGMDPYIAENIKLTNQCVLVNWLAKHGRIVHKSFNTRDAVQMSISREMNLLQCIISFPMIYKGKLVGIVNVDNKITGYPFYKEELEVIYLLCNYLAAAVKDIDLYHQIRYQKEFTKNILSSMNSGVVTINKNERISVFNQRAAEILNITPIEIIGGDLRKLPSPLGDILYETMTDGTSYRRHEVVIQTGKLPLGINSYRLTDEKGSPIGAVIIFTDLSDFKRLEEERRRSEKLEAVNILTGKIAHEIKNPLTAIQTFTQLLNEKYNDEEFRHYYTTTVMQSIRKIDNLMDKLVLFSGPLDYKPEKLDVNEIIDDAANYVWMEMPSGVRLVKRNLDRSAFVSADRKLLTKTLSYIVLTCADKSRKDDFVMMNADVVEGGMPRVEISITCSGTAFTEKEMESLLRPLLDIETFGMDLNVAISQKILGEHGGSIQIKSTDTGNAFVIALPLVESARVQTKRSQIDD